MAAPSWRGSTRGRPVLESMVDPGDSAAAIAAYASACLVSRVRSALLVWSSAVVARTS